MFGLWMQLSCHLMQVALPSVLNYQSPSPYPHLFFGPSNDDGHAEAKIFPSLKQSNLPFLLPLPQPMEKDPPLCPVNFLVTTKNFPSPTRFSSRENPAPLRIFPLKALHMRVVLQDELSRNTYHFQSYGNKLFHCFRYSVLYVFAVFYVCKL